MPTDGRVIRQAAERALARARAAGADDAEVCAVDGSDLEVRVRLGEVEQVKRSQERVLALRAFVGGGISICTTSDLSDEAIDTLAIEAAALARVTAQDPFAGLPDIDNPGPLDSEQELDLFDETACEFSVDQAIALARRCEQAAAETDPRIENSEGAEFSAGYDHVLLATTRGVFGEKTRSGFGLSATPVAKHSGGMERDYWSCSTRHFEDLESPESIGKKAAERTLRRLGGRTIPTRERVVLFEPKTAASLAGHLAQVLSASSIYRGTSFLAGQIGATIASAALNLVDDPHLPRKLGSRMFDAEGLATRRNVLIRNGVLEGYLVDTYSGRKLDLPSTASAVRSVGGTPQAGPSNLQIEAGAETPEQMLSAIQHGILITELIGFGFNAVTGDYSRGASGLLIENGEIAHPVSEITIAGNLGQMLRDIEVVGSDLELRSSISAPTLRIGAMTVAGSG